jgi:hypothetical protein
MMIAKMGKDSPVLSRYQIGGNAEEISLRAEAWMSEMRSAAPQDKPPAPPAGAHEGYHSITPYLQVEGAQRLIQFLKELSAQKRCSACRAGIRSRMRN